MHGKLRMVLIIFMIFHNRHGPMIVIGCLVLLLLLLLLLLIFRFFFEKQAVFVRLCAYGVRELIVRKNTTAPAAKSGVCGNGVVI